MTELTEEQKKQYYKPMISIVKSVNVETFLPNFTIRFAMVDTFHGNMVSYVDVPLSKIGELGEVDSLVKAIEKNLPEEFLFTTADLFRLPRSDDPVVKAVEEVIGSRK